MPAPPVIISHTLRKTFQRGLVQDKIIFLSAGPGWGKTAVTAKLLERQNAASLSLRKRPLPRYFSRERLIVLDDFQELPTQDETRFRDILRRSPAGQRFILLSRGPVPEYLSPYEAAGALLQLGEEDLALDMDGLLRLAQVRGLALSARDLQRMLEATGGCPAAAGLLLADLSPGQPLRKPAIDAMRSRMGAYLGDAFLRSLPPETQTLLLELSLFDRFDQDLADMLVEDGNARLSLEQLWRAGGPVRPDGSLWTIHDRRFLLPHLRQKLAGYPPGRLQAIQLAGGRWCAARQDFHGALCHYRLADREDILRSPELIHDMSMLHSMALAPEEAEWWYQTLKNHLRRMERGGKDYKRVRGLLFSLDLGLPHRDTAELPKRILAADKLLQSRSLVLPAMNVTGGLPSLLRGGRDFSQWVPRARELYDAIRAPAERVLGRAGVGVGELALGECLLEQGEDLSDRFLTLTALRTELRSGGVLEMEFVLTALLVRALCAAGDLSGAQALLLQFRSEAAQANAPRVLANLDAMRCRLSLLEDGQFAGEWFAEPPPEGEASLWADSYRLLTWVRCCLRDRAHHAALLMLGRLLDGFRRYNRPLDLLEAVILTAICRFRMGCEDWREHLTRALELGGRYGYTAVFTREGAALLPLLERFGRSGAAPACWDRILSGTVTQAGYYGRYLQPPAVLASPLTPKELMVLRLIGQNKSNEEICALMNIKLPTVKTHVRSLFKKLNAASRSEVRSAAKQLGLISSAVL